jgi:hypothetical protein
MQEKLGEISFTLGAAHTFILKEMDDKKNSVVLAR